MHKTLISILLTLMSAHLIAFNEPVASEVKEDYNKIFSQWTEAEFVQSFNEISDEDKDPTDEDINPQDLAQLDEEDIDMILSEFPEEDKELILKIAGFDWQESGTYQLPKSNSTITVPEGSLILMGSDVDKLLAALDAPSCDYLEAFISNDETFAGVFLASIKVGYVPMEDWESTHSQAILEAMNERIKKTFHEKLNVDDVNIPNVSWLLEPSVDKDAKTLSWAFDVNDEQNQAIAMVLKFGREGLESFMWFTDKTLYEHYADEFHTLVCSHHFNPGYRYEDYIPGDKVSSFSISKLMKTALGEKIADGGLLMQILKKVDIVLFAGMITGMIAWVLFFKRKT